MYTAISPIVGKNKHKKPGRKLQGSIYTERWFSYSAVAVVEIFLFCPKLNLKKPKVWKKVCSLMAQFEKNEQYDPDAEYQFRALKDNTYSVF